MNGVVVVAGSISTTLFVVSALPMLYKAARTRDLASYSIGNLLLANVGNAFYAVYVFSMPMGPIWALHSFYMLSSALMLFWYLRYEVKKRGRASERIDGAASTGSAGLLGVEQRRVVGGPLVEAREYGARSGREVGCLVILAGEGANVIKRVEDHHSRELDLIIKIAPQQVGTLIAVEPARSDSGSTCSLTIVWDASAFSGVVQPLQ